MRLAIAHPCFGSSETVLRIRRSRVPCTRSFGFAILWLSTIGIVDCQEHPEFKNYSVAETFAGKMHPVILATPLDRDLERGRFIHLDGPAGRTHHLNLEVFLPPGTDRRARISGTHTNESA